VVNGRAELILPDEPGIYSVTAGSRREPVTKVAVAAPAEESRLTYSAAPPALAAWVAPPDLSGPEPTVADGTGLSREEILGQRVWWLALLAALAALATESWWLMRKERE
jgi:hypothetical protein